MHRYQFSLLQLFKSIILSVCFILLSFHFPPQHAIWHLVYIFAKNNVCVLFIILNVGP